MAADHPSPGLEAAALDAARRRSQLVLAGGVALTSVGQIAAFTVATIAARALLGSDALTGLPAAVYVLGSAAGSISLAYLMSRTTRRLGLTVGFLASVAGGAIAAFGVAIGSFALLLLGMLLLGTGNSASQLSRYAAADMVPPARRASAIGLVVWAATFGSVVGPQLVEPAGRLATGAGLPELSGPLLVPIVFAGLATILAFVFLRPDPYRLAHRVEPGSPGWDRAAAPVRQIVRRPAILAAAAALIVGQFTMTLIMTMTPLHMSQHGFGLGPVGLVLSAHTLGMFALSPVSGRLTGRLGALSTIWLGTGVLVAASLLAAVADPMDGLVLGVALFLLGFGWNLGFVAGSSLLTSGLDVSERTRVQGLADALIWTTAAIASLGSGLVLQAAGFTTLGLLGAGVVLLPVWLFATRRHAILAVAGSGRPPAA
jgi:MFS family permease